MIDYQLFTNLGDRRTNEDYVTCRILNSRALFILNDGLGGQGLGDVASKLVADIVADLFISDYKAESFFHDAFNAAQESLKRRQEETGLRSSMMTTAVCLLMDEDRASWCHIGDSRLYFFRSGGLISRTMDHSVPQMLALSGEIEDKDIRFHEDRNRLLKAMGTDWRKFEPAISEPVSLEKGMSFLLCSDGFWELIEEGDILKYLRESGSAAEWIEAMGAHVCGNDGWKKRDNASAIGVRIL